MGSLGLQRYVCLGLPVLCLLLSSCQALRPDTKISAGHINKNEIAHSDKSAIPPPLTVAAPLPLPQPAKKEATHTVIVNNVPVAELLFSLARDAKLNLDIDGSVDGYITLNAINQPFNALLERIVESNDLTWEIKNDVLRIRKDTPQLRYYRLDHLNMARSSESKTAVSTQIAATGQGAGAEASGAGEGNNSSTEVKNKADNNFWDSISKNIAAILHKEAPPVAARVMGDAASTTATPATAATPAPAAADAANPNIILNRESGVIGVRASKKQHREIEAFFNEVLFSTKRQVLIEATIAEVRLSDGYQAGIDWGHLSNKLDRSAMVGQAFTDIVLFDRPAFTFQFDQNKSNGDSIQATLSALESFGDVSIMSSPKVMALNNQTALLKVVDNLVYFTVEVNIEPGDATTGQGGLVTYETQINTVPVGFVMSVTPYINENDSVTLNVRPTISRVIKQARDPNPALVQAGVVSEIPVIQVREVESVLKIDSGNTAVMGGLMQDEISKNQRGVPILSKLPFIGALFRYDADQTEKTELVIFIRPVVIKHASLQGDMKSYQDFLPADRGR